MTSRICLCALLFISHMLSAAAVHTADAATLVRNGRKNEAAASHSQHHKRSTMSRTTELLQEIEEIVRAGTTLPSDKVNEIKTIVTAELITDLQATHAEAKGRVATNLASIDLCNSQSVSRNAEIVQVTQSSVDTSREQHSQCRIEEKAKHSTSGTRCGALDTFLDGVNQPANMPTGRPREGMVQYVQTMSNYFCPKGPEVTRLDDECTQAENERVAHKVICDHKQATFESNFCTMRTEKVDTCSTLNSCYDAAKKKYDDDVKVSKDLVAKWKLEWAALQKILCYMDVWLKNDDVSTVDASVYTTCDGATPDTSSMDIDFGTPGAPATCSLASVAEYPGQPGFSNGEYNEVNQFAEPAIPCVETGNVVLAPTLAPASFAQVTTPAPRRAHTTKKHHATSSSTLEMESSVDADGTIHSAKKKFTRDNLHSMPMHELVELAKSLDSLHHVKAELASAVMDMQRTK